MGKGSHPPSLKKLWRTRSAKGTKAEGSGQKSEVRRGKGVGFQVSGT